VPLAMRLSARESPSGQMKMTRNLANANWQRRARTPLSMAPDSQRNDFLAHAAGKRLTATDKTPDARAAQWATR
jgi:hypothetical protein